MEQFCSQPSFTLGLLSGNAWSGEEEEEEEDGGTLSSCENCKRRNKDFKRTMGVCLAAPGREGEEERKTGRDRETEIQRLKSGRHLIVARGFLI